MFFVLSNSANGKTDLFVIIRIQLIAGFKSFSKVRGGGVKNFALFFMRGESHSKNSDVIKMRDEKRRSGKEDP